MTAYELPTSLNISGVDFSIRTDFRAIIDILIAMNDPELDEQAKAVVMLQILFEDWQSIPSEYIEETCQKPVSSLIVDNLTIIRTTRSPD